MLDSKREYLKVKAALENQEAKKVGDLRKMELTLMRYYKYGGHRELIDMYKPEHLEKAKKGEIY